MHRYATGPVRCPDARSKVATGRAKRDKSIPKQQQSSRYAMRLARFDDDDVTPVNVTSSIKKAVAPVNSTILVHSYLNLTIILD